MISSCDNSQIRKLRDSVSVLSGTQCTMPSCVELPAPAWRVALKPSKQTLMSDAEPKLLKELEEKYPDLRDRTEAFM